ncbi:Nuclear pore complex protein [Actinidia chinensis var. chinensis]|uniref:Nuclear pore complex protein n=1 Tax=Actinidia chinensis var. chinensis TaxID=1590841 RepID=A0A2R6PAJ7_ACTCC|nr:Nuclear pore complex protein [Actinidia chinensis var. chinensis]
MSNVHDFFVHVAAKVESIHQDIESMKTAYLAHQRHRGDVNDPFDLRETAKREAAARRVHPTLHLPAISQPSTQVAGLFASSTMPGASSAPHTSAAVVTSSSTGSGSSLFGTPSAATSSSSLFSTPIASAPTSSLFGASGASPQTPLFGASTPSFSTTASLFGSTPAGVSPFSTPFASGAATGSGASFGTHLKRERKVALVGASWQFLSS